MKDRREFAVLLIILIILAYGCSKSENTPIALVLDTEKSQELHLATEFLRSNNQLCNYGSLYYCILNDEWICFYDDTTGVSGKLCGKPECPHVSVGCNANLVGGGIQVYNEKLFLLQGNVLYKMNLDGTERKKVLEIVDGLHLISWGIHQGKLYYETEQQVIVDGKPYEDYALYMYSLEGKEHEVLLEAEYEGIFVPRWIIYEDYLCYLVDVDPQGNGRHRERSISMYYIPEGTWENISTSSSKWQILDWRMNEEGLYILEKAWEKIRVIFYDFAEGKAEELFCVDDMTGYVGIMASDGNSIVVYPRYEKDECKIYTMEGVEISSQIVDGIYWHLAAWGHDKTGYFFEARDSNEEGPICSLWRLTENGTEILCDVQE